MRRALAGALLAMVAGGCEGTPSPTPTATATAAATSAAAPAASAQPPAASREQLEAAVQAKLLDLRRDCYEPYLRKGGERLVKPLQLMLELDADGSVRDAAAAGGAADQRPLRSCIEDAARSWKLKPPGQRTELAATLPL